MDRLGRALSARMSPHVWLLSGPLGSGKTTLVRGILRGLGITQSVTSPTFTLQKIYYPKYLWARVVHIDAYRIKRASELAVLDLKHLVFDNAALVLIEWPERLPVRWSGPTRRVQFTLLSRGRRVRLTVTPRVRVRLGPPGQRRRQQSARAR